MEVSEASKVIRSIQGKDTSFLFVWKYMPNILRFFIYFVWPTYMLVVLRLTSTLAWASSNMTTTMMIVIIIMIIITSHHHYYHAAAIYPHHFFSSSTRNRLYFFLYFFLISLWNVSSNKIIIYPKGKMCVCERKKEGEVRERVGCCCLCCCFPAFFPFVTCVQK